MREYAENFGDDWRHRVVVEKVTAAEPGATYPTCIAGRRACPPEDCGGVWGYENFVAAMTDPAHAEHDALLEWSGGDYDPDAFDPSEFGHRLRLGRLVE